MRSNLAGFLVLVIGGLLASPAKADIDILAIIDGQANTCVTAAPIAFDIQQNRLRFECNNLVYLCTPVVSSVLNYQNNSLSVICNNGSTESLRVDVLVDGQQNGNGAGGICQTATDVVYTPVGLEPEFSWNCGSYQGHCFPQSEVILNYTMRIVTIGSCASVSQYIFYDSFD